jgi:hypothetical protein
VSAEVQVVEGLPKLGSGKGDFATAKKLVGAYVPLSLVTLCLKSAMISRLFILK